MLQTITPELIRWQSFLYRLTVKDCVLERETTFKYLGIVFNEKLSWADHIEFVRKKVNQRLGILHRFDHFLPFYAHNLFVNTMVLPFLDYCDIVWVIEITKY